MTDNPNYWRTPGATVEDPRPARAPAGLRAGGRRLWHDVVSGYALRIDETVVLAAACRLVDEIDLMEREIGKLDSLLVSGTRGSVKTHPLLTEVRSHRTALNRLLQTLALPEERTNQAAARSAAGRRMAFMKHHGTGSRGA